MATDLNDLRPEFVKASEAREEAGRELTGAVREYLDTWAALARAQKEHDVARNELDKAYQAFSNHSGGLAHVVVTLDNGSNKGKSFLVTYEGGGEFVILPITIV